ncbi:hypothetical protein KY306_03365 [Candidatus Woesearchaeota archaeon]|nr:hypothetical protein [Candidatus Woesearchaeota archaeon]
MELTQEERLALKILVKKEIAEVEDEEKEYHVLESNSPFLSGLLLKDKDIPFLASKEKYHQFLIELEKKL